MSFEKLKKTGWTPCPFPVLERHEFWSPFKEMTERNGQHFKVLEYTGVVPGSEYGYTFMIQFNDGELYEADLAELNGDYRYSREKFSNTGTEPESEKGLPEEVDATDRLIIVANENKSGNITRLSLRNQTKRLTLTTCDFEHGDVYYVAAPITTQDKRFLAKSGGDALYHESLIHTRLGVIAYAPHAWLYPYTETHGEICNDFALAVLSMCKGLVACPSDLPGLTDEVQNKVREAERLGIKVLNFDDIPEKNIWKSASEISEEDKV